MWLLYTAWTTGCMHWDLVLQCTRLSSRLCGALPPKCCPCQILAKNLLHHRPEEGVDNSRRKDTSCSCLHEIEPPSPTVSPRYRDIAIAVVLAEHFIRDLLVGVPHSITSSYGT